MEKETTPRRVVSSFEGARLLEVLVVFSRLGCLSFGGPIAHLGYFHAEVVQRRRWIDDAGYADLVALCQFLPGPASSQVVFALGMHRAGLLGAFVASCCFTMPSALLMIALAYGVAHVDLANAGWLHGLRIAAVAVVAQAVRAMGKKLCPDRARISLCIASAAALSIWPGALVQLGVIAIGAIVGLVLYRDRESASARPVEEAALAEPTAAKPRPHRAAVLALVSFFALLVLLPPLVAATRDTEAAGEVAAFDSFYRSGSLVFGGGHVVLPLLRAEVVPNGWLSDDRFLAGYGGAQALPGPLFAFAAYLGTAMDPSAADPAGAEPSWARGLLCLFAIFLPAWLLIGGALPFWQRLRARPGARAALQGANAVVVGVLLAALYDPVFVEAVHGPRDLVAALVAFVSLERWKAPPWTVVAASAAAGQWLL
jgi:chromate transporter